MDYCYGFLLFWFLSFHFVYLYLLFLRHISWLMNRYSHTWCHTWCMLLLHCCCLRASWIVILFNILYILKRQKRILNADVLQGLIIVYTIPPIVVARVQYLYVTDSMPSHFWWLCTCLTAVYSTRHVSLC